MTPALIHLVPIAKEVDPDKVTPGVLGFLVFAALGVALWLLVKNMNKQFQKIDFEEQPADEQKDAKAAGGAKAGSKSKAQDGSAAT